MEPCTPYQNHHHLLTAANGSPTVANGSQQGKTLGLRVNTNKYVNHVYTSCIGSDQKLI